MNKHTLKRAGLQFYDPEDFYAKEVTLRRGRETKVWIHKPSGHGLLDPENWVSDSYYEEEYREQFSAESNGQKKKTNEHFEVFKDLNQKQFNKFYKFINSATKFLEIGPSHGGIIAHVIDKADICHAVEPNIEDAQYLDKKFPKLQVYNTLLEDTLLQEDFYNVVVSFEVLEHTVCPFRFLKKINKSLVKSGALILEVPNHHDALLSCYNKDTNYDKFYYHKAHIHYFTPTSLKDICEKTGFVGQVDSFLMYPFFNHVSWHQNARPQVNASVALTSPKPTAGDSVTQLKIDNFYKKVEREYEEIINSSMVGDCLIFKGFKK